MVFETRRAGCAVEADRGAIEKCRTLLGDLTIAQTRYYGVLWPGLSVALTAAALLAGEWTRGGTAAIVALVLLPTLPGVVIASALAR